jgi:hypothetical protein
MDTIEHLCFKLFSNGRSSWQILDINPWYIWNPSFYLSWHFIFFVYWRIIVHILLGRSPASLQTGKSLSVWWKKKSYGSAVRYNYCRYRVISPRILFAPWVVSPRVVSPSFSNSALKNEIWKIPYNLFFNELRIKC